MTKFPVKDDTDDDEDVVDDCEEDDAEKNSNLKDQQNHV